LLITTVYPALRGRSRAEKLTAAMAKANARVCAGSNRCSPFAASLAGARESCTPNGRCRAGWISRAGRESWDVWLEVARTVGLGSGDAFEHNGKVLNEASALGIVTEEQLDAGRPCAVRTTRTSHTGRATAQGQAGKQRKHRQTTSGRGSAGTRASGHRDRDSSKAEAKG
jgi:hypothetical protein